MMEKLITKCSRFSKESRFEEDKSEEERKAQQETLCELTSELEETFNTALGDGPPDDLTSQQGTSYVYMDYTDDARNTDQAWTEMTACHIHLLSAEEKRTKGAQGELTDLALALEFAGRQKNELSWLTVDEDDLAYSMMWDGQNTLVSRVVSQRLNQAHRRCVHEEVLKMGQEFLQWTHEGAGYACIRPASHGTDSIDSFDTDSQYGETTLRTFEAPPLVNPNCSSDKDKNLPRNPRGRTGHAGRLRVDQGYEKGSLAIGKLGPNHVIHPILTREHDDGQSETAMLQILVTAP